MSTSPIIVLGSVNVDLVIRGLRLPAPGETVLGGEFYQAHGGKGANQAVAAARASGQPVTFIAAVGDDAFGTQAREQFAREKLDCRYVRTVGGQPTGVALILVDQHGENLISVASGANVELGPDDVDRVPEEVFRDAKVFLTCLESPLETVRRGLIRARDAGLTTILNPAPADPRIVAADMLSLVDVITPNEGEASLLAETSDGEQAAARLREEGCGACAVTLGSRGCLVVEESETRVEACRVAAIDATAAGDAFNGALAVALAEGRPLVEAARWATRAAAVAVTRPGAQPSLPTREEIEQTVGS